MIFEIVNLYSKSKWVNTSFCHIIITPPGEVLPYVCEQVIILEDDLEISPDFYEYFTATLPLLRRDPR